MAYIVDGNNVMGQRVGWHRDRAGARRRLVAELVAFARSTGESVEVVFDGPPDAPPAGEANAALPHAGSAAGVRVSYAPRGSDADTHIRYLVEHAPDPRRLNVVTSDRRLAEDVRRCGAQVIRSGALRRRLDALVADGQDGTM